MLYPHSRWIHTDGDQESLPTCWLLTTIQFSIQIFEVLLYRPSVRHNNFQQTNESIMNQLWFGGCDLEEEEVVFITKLLPLPMAYLSVRIEVNLVGKNHDLYLCISIVDDLLQPITFDVLIIMDKKVPQRIQHTSHHKP